MALTIAALLAQRQWRGETFAAEKEPELAVTNYTSLLVGRRALEFEVVGFPLDAADKKVVLRLDVCDTAGATLHTFPDREMELSELRVETFSLPSAPHTPA